MNNLFLMIKMLHKVGTVPIVHFPSFLLLIKHVINSNSHLHLGMGLRNHGFGPGLHVAAAAALLLHRILALLAGLHLTRGHGRDGLLNLFFHISIDIQFGSIR